MAKNKLYAVKAGRKPGIYLLWSECEQQIKGFSGAEYKSFTNIDDANEYMSESSKAPDLFIEKCPDCGMKSLEVVSCLCYMKGVVLEKDGFIISSAKNIDTEDETIRCTGCGAQFSLAELTIKW